MTIPNSMKIAILEVKDKLDLKAPIEESIKKAMKLMKDHWLICSNEQQFRCAVGAVMLTYPDARPDLEAEIKVLQALSAASAGVPIDLESTFDHEGKVYNLLAIWHEVNK
jgi:hypothetical protein